MARLQILQLPEGASDDRPPFILVVDQVPTDEAGFDALRRDLGTPDDLIERIGARAIFVFEDTVDIPINGTRACLGEVEVAGSDSHAERTDQAEAKLKALFDEAAALHKQLDEARQWARHGYEIGQRHCGWSDHGVAPDWLTEGWPRSFDSCEHLKQAAAFDEALTRVRSTPTEPEFMNAEQERPDIWLHGYKCGVLAAKAATRLRDEETRKP